jgi:8-oxo-dGTP pyrophosphatase MutT (NUDIX family)
VSPADELQAYDGSPELRAPFLAAARAGALSRDDRPDHLTASALVLDASRTHVLLVLHKKVRLWMQPGGHLERGDTSLAQAALREAVEETGVADLRLATGRPLDLHRHAAPCGARDHLDVRFLVLAPDGATPVVSDESDDVRWFPVDALPPDAVPDLAAFVALGR